MSRSSSVMRPLPALCLKLRMVMRLLQAYRSDSRGVTAVIFALSSMVLIGMVGAGIDYGRLNVLRSQAQSATDAGVIAGGNTLKLAHQDTQSVTGVIERTIRANARFNPGAAATIQISISSDRSTVTASVQETVPLVFGKVFGFKAGAISVHSQATLVGKTRLCVLVLDPASKGALTVQNNASITASQCSVYSDSSDPNGFMMKDQASINATSICSAGGSQVSTKASGWTTPKTGCPALADPLASNPPPTSSGCTYTNVNVTVAQTLNPGTYCNGLHIASGAIATLSPGVYIIDSGPLNVDNNATLTGSYVGIFLKNQQATLNFAPQSVIDLSAPKSGQMAGLLIFEDPTAPIGREHKISSGNARQLLGTIYIPQGKLTVDAQGSVADLSAYTVIVARQLNVANTADLTMNAMYAQSDVPVPKGVGDIGGNILITQ